MRINLNSSQLKIRTKLFLLTVLFVFISCSSDNSTSTGNIIAPPSKAAEKLNITRVNNIAGGAEIIYELLEPENTIIMIEYGREKKVIHGEEFPTSFTLKDLPAEKMGVSLYTIYKGTGNASEKVVVEIEPLLTEEIKYMLPVLESIEINPILRGIRFKYEENKNKKPLDLFLSYSTDGTEWFDYGKLSISDESGNLLIKDIENDLREDFPYSQYKLYIIDETGTRTGDKYFEVPPIIEQMLDKTKWSDADLEGDNNAHSGRNSIERMWDNDFASRFEGVDADFPHWFTVDLGEGQDLKLTRFMMWRQTSSWWNYYRFTPKDFELWGSTEANPSEGDDWSSWEKISSNTVIKPSGKDEDWNNAIDLEYSNLGDVYIIPDDKVKSYRYLRFKVLNLWNVHSPGSTRITLKEISLWGIE